MSEHEPAWINVALKDHDQPPPSYEEIIRIASPIPPSISPNLPNSSPSQIIYSPATVTHQISTPPSAVIVACDAGITQSANSVNITSFQVKKVPTANSYEEYCPKCKCLSLTKQKYISGSLTWILAIIILVIFFPFAYLPFIFPSCKDVEHRCGKCGMVLGIKYRIPM